MEEKLFSPYLLPTYQDIWAYFVGVWTKNLGKNWNFLQKPKAADRPTDFFHFAETFETQKLNLSLKLFVLSSVIRLGDFCNFLATNFITKVAQMIGNFWGNFENHCILRQIVVVTFRAIFGQTWATFYPNIWSHWF